MEEEQSEHLKQLSEGNSKIFKVAHINIQCLNTSYNALLDFIKDTNIDFLAITEHWQTEEQLDSYHINGYMKVTSYCRKDRLHGGSVIYARNELLCKDRSDISKFSVSGVIECCALESYLSDFK